MGIGSKAFDFLGKLGNSINIGRYCSSNGNPVMACINTGIDLLDATKNVISCIGEVNRTNILRNELYHSKIMLDSLCENEYENSKKILHSQSLLFTKKLDRLRTELETEYQVVFKTIQAEKQNFKRQIELENKIEKSRKLVRILVKDIITVSQASLQELCKKPSKYQIEIENLQESIRIALKQYNKMIQLITN